MKLLLVVVVAFFLAVASSAYGTQQDGVITGVFRSKDPVNGVYQCQLFFASSFGFSSFRLYIPCDGISPSFTNLQAIDDANGRLFFSLGDNFGTIYQVSLGTGQIKANYTTSQYGNLQHIYYDQYQEKIHVIFERKFLDGVPVLTIDPKTGRYTFGPKINAPLAIGTNNVSYSIDYGLGKSYFDLKQWDMGSGIVITKRIEGFNNSAPAYNSVVGLCYSPDQQSLFAHLIYYFNIREEPTMTHILQIDPDTAYARIIANITTVDGRLVRDIFPLYGTCGDHTYTFVAPKDPSNIPITILDLEYHTIIQSGNINLNNLSGGQQRLLSLAYLKSTNFDSPDSIGAPNSLL